MEPGIQRTQTPCQLWTTSSAFLGDKKKLTLSLSSCVGGLSVLLANADLESEIL
jgi:hypothetical protein